MKHYNNTGNVKVCIIISAEYSLQCEMMEHMDSIGLAKRATKRRYIIDVNMHAEPSAEISAETGESNLYIPCKRCKV